MTEPRKLGEVVTGLATTGTTAMASSEPSTVDWASISPRMVDALPARLDDDMLGWVRSLAKSPLPALVPADAEFFVKCMRTLTILPSRPDDEIRGALRVALYERHFGGYCEEALSYLVKEATIRCKFLPTPSECKAILDEWKRNDPASQAKAKAQVRARAEKQARFDAIMASLAAREMDDAHVAALPKAVKMIAVERGYLRLTEGEFVIRHGGERVAPVAPVTAHAPEPRCKCQGIGRVLTLEGKETDCECRLEVAQA